MSKEETQVSLYFHNAAFDINLSFACNFPQKWREALQALQACNERGSSQFKKTKRE